MPIIILFITVLAAIASVVADEAAAGREALA